MTANAAHRWMHPVRFGIPAALILIAVGTWEVAVGRGQMRNIIHAVPGDGVFDGNRIRSYSRRWTMHTGACEDGDTVSGPTTFLDETVSFDSTVHGVGLIRRVRRWRTFTEPIVDTSEFERQSILLMRNSTRSQGLHQGVTFSGAHLISWMTQGTAKPDSHRIAIRKRAFDERSLDLLIQSFAQPYRPELKVEFPILQIYWDTDTTYVYSAYDTIVVVGTEQLGNGRRSEAWVIDVLPARAERFWVQKSSGEIVRSEARGGETLCATAMTP